MAISNFYLHNTTKQQKVVDTLTQPHAFILYTKRGVNTSDLLNYSVILHKQVVNWSKKKH